MRNVDELISDLQETNFKWDASKVGTGVNAEFLNEVTRALGCKGDFAVDFAAGGGSNIFVALMHQNLLLAKRIQELEERLNEKL